MRHFTMLTCAAVLQDRAYAYSIKQNRPSYMSESHGMLCTRLLGTVPGNCVSLCQATLTITSSAACFCVADPPAGGRMLMVDVEVKSDMVADSIIQASTCSHTVRMPVYSSYAVLEMRMQSVVLVDMTFTDNLA